MDRMLIDLKHRDTSVVREGEESPNDKNDRSERLCRTFIFMCFLTNLTTLRYP